MSNKKLNPERETAQDYSATDVKLFSDDGTYTDRAVENIGKVLDEIRTKNGWNNSQLLKHFAAEIYPSEATISRLVNHEKNAPPVPLNLSNCAVSLALV